MRTNAAQQLSLRASEWFPMRPSNLTQSEFPLRRSDGVWARKRQTRDLRKLGGTYHFEHIIGNSKCDLTLVSNEFHYASFNIIPTSSIDWRQWWWSTTYSMLWLGSCGEQRATANLTLCNRVNNHGSGLRFAITFFFAFLFDNELSNKQSLNYIPLTTASHRNTKLCLIRTPLRTSSKAYTIVNRSSNSGDLLWPIGP